MWTTLSVRENFIGEFKILYRADVLIGALRYFTILIPLNTIDENGGGTEIWSKAVKYSDLVLHCLIKCSMNSLLCVI